MVPPCLREFASFLKLFGTLHSLEECDYLLERAVPKNYVPLKMAFYVNQQFVALAILAAPRTWSKVMKVPPLAPSLSTRLFATLVILLPSPTHP